MNKKIIYLLIFSCSISSPTLCQDGVSVTLSGKTQMNFGIDFAIVNIESEIIYYSKRISLFHQNHSIIENLPPGTYRLFLFSWSSTIESMNNPIHEYFGILEFKENRSYYLGNFLGKYSEEGLYYIIENTSIPKRITKALRKKKLIDREDEIIKTYPYNADTLIIDPKFIH